MLSKDHFSNVLNEPAGKVASQVLKWVVPQIIQCYDDERIDPQRTINRIIGVLHHPALREYGEDGANDGRRLMFDTVQRWWGELDDRERAGLRDQLSREGVESGRNHKPGVHDKGHGCGKPLGMPTLGTVQSSGATGGPAGALLGGISDVLGGSSSQSGFQQSGGSGISKMAGEAVGGGALGGLVGGLVGGIGGDLLGGSFKDNDKKSYKRESYGQGGSYNQSHTEVGQSGGRYGQAEYRTEDSGQRHKETYERYGQDSSGGYGGFESREEQRVPGGFQQTYESSYESRSGGYATETRREETSYGGGYSNTSE